jgi:hypothetical protein
VAALLVSACAFEVEGPGDADPAAQAPVDGSRTEQLADVLAEALVQEESSKATYDAAVAQFGPVAPFTRIAREEAEHVSTLRALAADNGIVISREAVPGSPAAPDRASECLLAGQVEASTIEMYDRLLPKAKGLPDVHRVLSDLRADAKNRHMPVLRRCSG